MLGLRLGLFLDSQSSGGGSAPPVLPATLTVPFGVNTPNLYGGYPVCFTAAGTPVLTGTAATYFQITTVVDENAISWQMLTAKASRAGLGGTSTTGTLTLGAAVCALTINHEANSWDVRPNQTVDQTLAEGITVATNQLRSVWQNAALAMGDTVWLRDGDYNIAQQAYAIRRAAVVTGTWTGSNWVRFRGRTAPASPFFSAASAYGTRIRKLTIEGNTVKNQYFSVEDIHGYRPNPGSSAGGCFQLGANTSFPVAFARFYNCRFSSDESSATTTGGATATRHSGVSGQDTCQDIFVQGCYFVGLYDGVNVGGGNVAANVEGRITVENNLFNEVWNDCCKLTNAHPVYIRNNAFINKKYGSGGLHGDFVQLLNSGTAAGSYDFGEVSGNIMMRGSGTAANGDGQGIFHTCASPNRGGVGGASIRYTNPRIFNNLIEITFARGITLSQCDGGTVERSTLLQDTTNISPTSAFQPTIYLRDCGLSASAVTVRRCIMANSAVLTEVTDAAGSNVTGPNPGSDAKVATTLNVYSATGSIVAGYLAGPSSSALLSSFPTITAVQAAYAATSGALLGDSTYAGRFTNTGAENAA